MQDDPQSGDPPQELPALLTTHSTRRQSGFPRAAARWLDRVDPGTHRRIKGLRLVTAYGIAAALGTLQDVTHGLPAGVSPGYLASNFALWASVSEARSTRPESSRDLAL